MVQKLASIAQKPLQLMFSLKHLEFFTAHHLHRFDWNRSTGSFCPTMRTRTVDVSSMELLWAWLVPRNHVFAHCFPSSINFWCVSFDGAMPTCPIEIGLMSSWVTNLSLKTRFRWHDYIGITVSFCRQSNCKYETTTTRHKKNLGVHL